MTSPWSRLASHLQLPAIFFDNPILAVCFPVALGGFIGYQSGTRAKQIYGPSVSVLPSFQTVARTRERYVSKTDDDDR